MSASPGLPVARRAAALLALGALAACARRPPPPSAARYLVGAPYQLGGVWSYPREEFDLVQTGLASVAADRRAGRRTANGEVHDPALLTAAHRTLQLPAILQVTNLENGLQLELRVNDRGPAHPGRVLELSRRAAELLGIPPAGTAQLRVAVAAEASRALAAGLPNPEAPSLQVAAAPVGTVQREELTPPPGAAQAARPRLASTGPRPAEVVPAALPQVPDRLPERLTRGFPQPGRLFVEAASFGRRDLADRQAAAIGARVEAIGPRNRQSFRVRVGPLPSVAEADRALERTLRAGVSEARIVVD